MMAFIGPIVGIITAGSMCTVILMNKINDKRKWGTSKDSDQQWIKTLTKMKLKNRNTKSNDKIFKSGKWECIVILKPAEKFPTVITFDPFDLQFNEDGTISGSNISGFFDYDTLKMTLTFIGKQDKEMLRWKTYDIPKRFTFKARLICSKSEKFKGCVWQFKANGKKKSKGRIKLKRVIQEQIEGVINY
eukprot:78551_1